MFIENIMIFLVLIFCIYASYYDIKYKKIKNSIIILILLVGLFGHLFLIIQGLPLLIFFSTTLGALLIGIFLWYNNVWSAGDSKLYWSISTALPVTIYKYFYSPFFLEVEILMNTLIPISIILLVFLLLKTNKKQIKNSIKQIINLDYIKSFFINFFAFYTLAYLIFSFLKIPYNYFLMIFSIGIIFIFFERIFRKKYKKYLLYSLCGIMILLILSNSISLISIFLIAIAFVILTIFINISFEQFCKKIKINNLKEGMVSAENVFLFNEKFIKEKINIFFSSIPKNKVLIDTSPKGITKQQIKMLKYYKKIGKIKFDNILIQEPLPFAPLIFVGVVLTLIFHGNVLIQLFS